MLPMGMYTDQMTQIHAVCKYCILLLTELDMLTNVLYHLIEYLQQNCKVMPLFWKLLTLKLT